MDAPRLGEQRREHQPEAQVPQPQPRDARPSGDGLSPHDDFAGAHSAAQQNDVEHRGLRGLHDLVAAMQMHKRATERAAHQAQDGEHQQELLGAWNVGHRRR